MVANEYGIPFAKFLHKRLHISKNEQLRRHYGNNDAKFATERTSVSYLSTHWLIGILNFESRISDIESGISKVLQEVGEIIFKRELI
jgi:hypothetical protein